MWFVDLSTNLDDYEVGKSLQVTSILSESKHWIVVQLPVAYMATNWPIRVSTPLFDIISLFDINDMQMTPESKFISSWLAV